ncbi:MAG: hypothetical protein ABF289_09825 [Clostridiales bacterium]
MEKWESVEILWNYLKMNHSITKVDLIVDTNLYNIALLQFKQGI